MMSAAPGPGTVRPVGGTVRSIGDTVHPVSGTVRPVGRTVRRVGRLARLFVFRVCPRLIPARVRPRIPARSQSVVVVRASGRLIGWCGLALLLAGCAPEEAGDDAAAGYAETQTNFAQRSGREASTSIRFADVTAAAGIDFVHATGAFGEKWMPETMGSGVLVLDYDGDEWPDLFFVNSTGWDGRAEDRGATPALFRNLGDGTFANETRDAGLGRPIYGMGGGAADFDGDGDVDLYVTAVGDNRLYRNDGGVFTDVTEDTGAAGNAPGAGDPAWSTAAAWFDADADGWLDLLVCNYVDWTPETDLFFSRDGVNKSYATPEEYSGESCRLLRNEARPAGGRESGGGAGDVGSGTDTGSAESDGGQGRAGQAESAARADGRAEGSGGMGRAEGGAEGSGGAGGVGRAWGDGGGGRRFRDVTAVAGLDNPEGKSLGIAIDDFNGDGRPDIAIANDTYQNFLYENRGDGTFADVALDAGVAFDEFGRARAGMGVDVGDILNRGQLSIGIGNFSNEPVALFTQIQAGLFQDLAGAARLTRSTLLPLTFGLRFADFDMDRHVDLVLGNGHIEPEIEAIQGDVTFAQPPQLFRNDGRGGFLDVGSRVGGGFGDPVVARGVATLDFDRDGDLDLVITTNGGPPKLLRNDLEPGPGWVRVRLDGAAPNTGAVGAIVHVFTAGSARGGDTGPGGGDTGPGRDGSPGSGGPEGRDGDAGGGGAAARPGVVVGQRFVISTSSSYLSQSETNPVLAGLGGAARADSVVVRWPGGGRSVSGPIESGGEIVIREERGDP